MRPGAVAPVIVLVVCSATAASARPPSFALRFEGGAEYDTNPTRRETLEGVAEQQPALPSAAARLAVAGDLAHRPTERLQLSLGGGLALRRLMRPEAEGEDMVITDARATVAYAVTDAWMLGATGAYYDVIQRADSLAEARDFRSVAPGLRLYGPAARGRVALGGGWRWFQFKPEPALDFAGPTASLGYRRTFVSESEAAAEWDWGLGASLEQRLFPAQPCPAATACVAARRDRFVALDADVTRTADQLVGGGLSLQHNASNSYGEGLWRLLAHVRLVWLLPLEFSVAARAELVATRYDDHVPVGHDRRTGAFVTIDDEGRSSLRLDLSRPLDGRLEGGVRYTYYTQTPGTAVVHFQRHVTLLYLALPLGH
jgi:hypothetical protein